MKKKEKTTTTTTTKQKEWQKQQITSCIREKVFFGAGQKVRLLKLADF